MLARPLLLAERCTSAAIVCLVEPYHVQHDFSTICRTLALCVPAWLAVAASWFDTDLGASRRRCGATSTRSSARTRSRAIPPPSGTSAAPATRSIQGFATNISVTPGRDRAVQDRHERRTTTRSTSIAWAITAAWAPARSRPSRRRPTLPQNQPNCLTNAATGLDRLRQLGGVGVVARAGRCGLGHLLRHARLASTPAARATSSSSFAKRHRAHQSDVLFQTSDTTWQAYNQLRRQQPLRRRSRHEPGRAYKVSYNRPFNDARHCARRLRLQRRIPDGALARGERLRRQLHQRRRHRSARRRMLARSTRCSCRSGTTSTGRARSARTSRPRAPPACTWRSSAATRCSGRRAGRPASTASNTPYRTLVCLQGDARQRDDRSRRRADVDRHLARPALQSSRRRRSAGERVDRHAVHGERRRHRRAITVPAAERQDAFLAEHHRRDAAGRRHRDAAAPARSATNGTRTPNNGFRPPGLMRLSSTTPSGQRECCSTTARRTARARVTHKPDALSPSERRAGLRRRHRAVVVGSRLESRPRHRSRPTCA